MIDTGFKTCSFCGKGENRVQSMFSSGNTNICDECVMYCYEIIAGPADKDKDKTKQKLPKKSTDFTIKLKKPVEIKNILDQYIIGQDKAKIALSVSVYNHYKRLLSNTTDDDVEIQKSNVLLLGPTGVGKEPDKRKRDGQNHPPGLIQNL